MGAKVVKMFYLMYNIRTPIAHWAISQLQKQLNITTILTYSASGFVRCVRLASSQLTGLMRSFYLHEVHERGRRNVITTSIQGSRTNQ